MNKCVVRKFSRWLIKESVKAVATLGACLVFAILVIILVGLVYTGLDKLCTRYNVQAVDLFLTLCSRPVSLFVLIVVLPVAVYRSCRKKLNQIKRECDAKDTD